MKKALAYPLLLCILSLHLQAQSNFRIRIFSGGNGSTTEFFDGENLRIPCVNNTSSFQFSAAYTLNGQTRLMPILNASSVSIPGGYSAQNYMGDNSSLYVTYNYPQDGTLTFTAQDGGLVHNFTYNLRSSPDVSRTAPSAPLANNQSGTLSVNILDQTGSGAAVASAYSQPYTSVNWQAQYGLSVNGSNTYTTGNTGSNNTAPVSTINYGGRIYVSATNVCGTSNQFSYSENIGTPYLVNTQVNGTNGSSATVSQQALMEIFTNGSATGANWVITNGSGSISTRYTSCYAYPNNFLRVVATPTNSSGSGQEATFYIMKQGNSGYRMTSSNPAKEQVSADFDDPIIAKELLTDFSLLDEKGKTWQKFDFENAKKTNYFESSKSISLPVNSMPPGTYYLHTKLGDKLYSERILL